MIIAKDLIITLYGSTIPLNKKSIMFPSMQHRFKDVSISTVYPPIQVWIIIYILFFIYYNKCNYFSYFWYI